MSGELLKMKVKELNLSQRAIAEALGITPQSLTSIFRAEDVRSGTIEKIAQAANVPMSFFYPDSGSVNVSRAHNVNTGSGFIDASGGASVDTLRIVLEQNSQLIELLKKKEGA